MYKKGLHGWYKHIDFLIIDMICWQLAFLLSYHISILMGFNSFKVTLYSNNPYAEMALNLLLISIAVSFFTDSFKNVVKRGIYKEFVATIKQAFYVMVILLIYLFAKKISSNYSRSIILMLSPVYIVLAFAFRILWKEALLKNIISKGTSTILIITTKKCLKNNNIFENIQIYKGKNYILKGYALLEDNCEGKEIDGNVIVADRSTLKNYLTREWIDEVFVMTESDDKYPSKLMNGLTDMGIATHYEIADASSLDDNCQFVEKIGRYTVITTVARAPNPWELVCKRIMDIIGGIAGCIITLLLTLIVGPLIYIQSPGPIFFSQERIGKNGKKFKMYKFRSMYLDAEERKKELMAQNRVKDGMMFKLDWDPRIIGAKKLPNGKTKKGIGNFIRDWSIDEFPQFFNVLKGDMSVVGTRPPTVDEWEKYDTHHRIRMATKPGVTGIWQVSGRSNITDFEEIVKLDKSYIMNWNIGLDIKILLKTLVVVLKKEGSM
ncbi:MAG: exopolysaccharide biosynthesis polyprenyl glycosylphosphotransferase [Firmicutes bacterium]|nr:exopolysaccharide biosynthesis polyprenyl glycosylphosphotransferase [Bacillota bacterium]